MTVEKTDVPCPPGFIYVEKEARYITVVDAEKAAFALYTVEVEKH